MYERLLRQAFLVSKVRETFNNGVGLHLQCLPSLNSSRKTPTLTQPKE
jgi:hypothetical protein